MLLRGLRCDELGVCQARHPFCQGCFDPIAPPAKMDKIKASLRGGRCGEKDGYRSR
jgi:hypothetical protein